MTMDRKLHLITALFGGMVAINGSHAQIAFTTNSTLLSGTYGNPACVIDVDSDGDDDIIRFSGTQMFVAYQQANGTFTEQSFGNATVSPNWSICAGDLNADGHMDVLIGNGSANSFMFSNGDGTSYSETYFPAYIFSQRTNMADINNDGLLDAFSCHDVGLSRPYRNTGLGTVELDQSLIQQVTSVGGNYSTMFTDLDNDGDLDLYFSKCRGGAPVGDPQRINLHYQNNGDGTWSEIGQQSGLYDGSQSWTSVIEDFNNDGWFDVFIVNHTDGNRLMMNNQDGTFSNMIAGSGIGEMLLGAWEGQAADFDNDGWIDIFSEVGGGIYRNNGDGTFTDQVMAVKEGGIGDLNNDGWLDINRGGNIYLNSGGSNHWIKIALEGIISNTDGIGARLWLYGDWGVQTREVRSGTGFSHMSSLTAHFGIGQATSIDSLIIDWPSGVHTVMHGPAIDTFHVIAEAECVAPPIEISANGDTEICPGGSVELVAPEGFESYQWSNGATTQTIQASTGGNYTLTAFDSEGCAALSNAVPVQVITDVAPVITIDGDEVICEGSGVELISSNMSNAVWSNGATGGVVMITEAGTYTVTADGQCDAVTSLPVTIEVNPAPEMPVADDVIIPVAGPADLFASGENILWYLTESDVTSVGTGNSWQTPFLNSGTTFWAEANAIYGGDLQDGGKPDNSGAGGLPSSGSYSFFDSWEPFVIETVTVYAIGDGIRTVNLCDAAGNVLQSANFDLTDGTHELTLNFDVPVGSDMSLRCPQNNLFRNSGGVSYPYPIGEYGELTTSGFGTSWYYYFYAWKVRTEPIWCPSERVPVTVQIGTVGIQGLNDDGSVHVYPVPSNTEVRIDGTFAGDVISVFDAQGRLVQQQLAGVSGTTVMNVESLNSGSYLLNLRSNERNVVRDMIIVR